jgi:hypothetical protein
MALAFAEYTNFSGIYSSDGNLYLSFHVTIVDPDTIQEQGADFQITVPPNATLNDINDLIFNAITQAATDMGFTLDEGSDPADAFIMANNNNIPKSVQISAFKYKIQKNQGYLDREAARTGENLAGLSEFGKQLITVGPAAEDYMADTLLHEILHQCLRVVAFEMDEDDEKIEERIIATMTPILLDTLRRNPEIVDYLLNNVSDST